MNKRMKKKREIESKVKYLESMLDYAIHEIIRQDKEIEKLKQVNSRNSLATNSRFNYLEKKVADKVPKKSWFPQVSSILTHPDYIGRNKNIKSDSFEVIKILEDNVLVAVKLDRKNDYFYVASVYDVTDSKLEHMKKSGRIKEFDSQAKL